MLVKAEIIMTLFVHTEHYWPGNLSVQCFVFTLLCELSIFEKCCLSTCKFYSYFFWVMKTTSFKSAELLLHQVRRKLF